MKISLFILGFFGVLPVFAQQDITIKNGEEYNPRRVAPFLNDLYSSNEYVVSFRVRMTDRADEKSDYFVLTKNGNSISAYEFLKKNSKLEQLELSEESLELVWKTFLQNDLFSLRNEEDIANFCLEKYQIYNSYTYEFVLLNKDSMKMLSYYDPEHYDNVCYGMPERKKIINSSSVISHVQAGIVAKPSAYDVRKKPIIKVSETPKKVNFIKQITNK